MPKKKVGAWTVSIVHIVKKTDTIEKDGHFTILGATKNVTRINLELLKCLIHQETSNRNFKIIFFCQSTQLTIPIEYQFVKMNILFSEIMELV